MRRLHVLKLCLRNLVECDMPVAGSIEDAKKRLEKNKSLPKKGGES